MADCTRSTAIHVLAIAIIIIIFIIIVVIAIKLGVFGGRQRRGPTIGGGVRGFVRLDLMGQTLYGDNNTRKHIHRKWGQ